RPWRPGPRGTAAGAAGRGRAARSSGDHLAVAHGGTTREHGQAVRTGQLETGEGRVAAERRVLGRVGDARGARVPHQHVRRGTGLERAALVLVAADLCRL